MKDFQQVIHPLDPIADKHSRILILGTMPSPKSREDAFYYAHPRNRFWAVLSRLFGVTLETKEEKTNFLLSHNIALWDVLHSCDIISAADSSIKNPTANDISGIVKDSDIKMIFTTGKTAFDLYNRLCRKDTGIDAIPLPSTSPANARMTLNTLVEEYAVILKYI